MLRRPPRPTRTHTLVPSTTLCRSQDYRSNAVAIPPLPPGRSPRHSDQYYYQCGFGTTRRRALRRESEESEITTVGHHPNAVVETGTSRSEEHTSELQSLMRISYAVFCLKKNINNTHMIQHLP